MREVNDKQCCPSIHGHSTSVSYQNSFPFSMIIMSHWPQYLLHKYLIIHSYSKKFVGLDMIPGSQFAVNSTFSTSTFIVRRFYTRSVR